MSASDAQRALWRRRGLVAVTLGLGAAALVWAMVQGRVLQHTERTDNAYVHGNLVQMTPLAGGTVVEIWADDGDRVAAGQTLIKLDATDAQLALDQAEAQLAQAVRELRVIYANHQTLRAQVRVRAAELAKARSEVVRTGQDAARRQGLLASGAVGQEEWAHSAAQWQAARNSQAAAQAAWHAAIQALASNQALTEGLTVADHPNVKRAAARVREAYVARSRMSLLAPMNGVVARRAVQIGQRVAAGAPLMQVVALDEVWVEANFKEGQLRRLRINQPVLLQADVYGDSVTYHGRITGLGAGTGAAFALLPAQNATGNWIKIVQRVPVRIGLDPQELAAHPLRVGLSMHVTVDVRESEGAVLTEHPRAVPVAQTSVFDAAAKDAEQAVARIIAAHSGQDASVAASTP
jgi:membrane fusion protein (multidrug efflux system)